MASGEMAQVVMSSSGAELTANGTKSEPSPGTASMTYGLSRPWATGMSRLRPRRNAPGPTLMLLGIRPAKRWRESRTAMKGRSKSTADLWLPQPAF